MLKIEYIDVAKLKPYDKNTRKHEDYDVSQIAASIEQYGFNDPIGIWGKDNIIVEGHGRLLAAKKLGMEKVPCIRLDDLTDEQRREYAIMHNKTAELSTWDFDLLAEEIPELDFSGFDVDWGLPADVEETEIVEDEAPEVDEEHEPICQLGDIWQLGRHKLICGDSTDKATVERLMDGKKADMVFTDPPYGMNAVSKSGVLSERYKTDIMNDDTNEVAIAAFLLCQKMFADVKQVWWGANYYTECLPSAECWIVWDKNNGESDQTDCELGWINFRSVVRQFTLASEKTNRVHPTQKPIKLIQMILDKFDKDKSYKVILDLFGGSGSTLIACEQLGRVCYMAELDEHYCDVILKRYENLTGQKAVKIS